MTDINVRRHPQPFQPGELVYVRPKDGAKLFDPALIYEIKDGPTRDGYYDVWTDSGPRRYEFVQGAWLVSASPLTLPPPAPNLGLATTRELLAEITARIDVDYSAGGGGLDYTTVHGRPVTPAVDLPWTRVVETDEVKVDANVVGDWDSTADVQAIDAYGPGDEVLKQNRAGFWGTYRSPDGRMGGTP